MITLNHIKTFKGLMAVSVAGSLLAGCASEHRGGGGNYYYSSSTTSTSRQSGSQNASSDTSAQNNINISGDQTTTIPLFKEEAHVGKRTVDAGSVRLQKTVKTETVNVPIELREETVTVNRQDASGASHQNQSMAQNDQRLNQPFQEGQVEIRLQREEPVIEKQIVQNGSIVVQKHSQSQQRNISSDVRRDDITVAKSGDSQNINISSDLQSSSEQGMGGTAESSAQYSGGASSDQITDISRLSAENASQCDGRSVKLSSVKVQQSYGDRLIALKAGEKPVYVQLSQPQHLQAGQTVTVTGTVKALSQTSMPSDLDQQGTQALQGQSLYIDAKNVETN
jgi:stress response protein YsnF